MNTAGYSGRPLAAKLGFKEGSTVHVIGAPAHYKALLAPIPAGVTFATKVSADTDIVHVFVTRRTELATRLSVVLPAIKPDAAIWVSWPKKASKMPTDITEDVIRELALPMGLVDVKVCAVDETWSGLKLVIRKALRSAKRGR